MTDPYAERAGDLGLKVFVECIGATLEVPQG
jgi:hypothetical protein